jgi:hypothetical protein
VMQLISEFSSPASISALAALCGSLIGALGSSVGAWIAQRHENRRDLLAKNIFHREQMYSDFIRETAPAIVDAIQHTLHDPSKLVPIYALLGHIRLSSSNNVIGSAERVVQASLVHIRSRTLPTLPPRRLKRGSTEAVTHFANSATSVVGSLTHCGANSKDAAIRCDALFDTVHAVEENDHSNKEGCRCED